jgi:hypothetical protein
MAAQMNLVDGTKDGAQLVVQGSDGHTEDMTIIGIYECSPNDDFRPP